MRLSAEQITNHQAINVSQWSFMKKVEVYPLISFFIKGCQNRFAYPMLPT